jgi:hypothetical protein
MDALSLVGKNRMNKTRMDKPIAKVRKSPQPPPSYHRAVSDSDRAKNLASPNPLPSGAELNPGDGLEELRNFGKPTGELGTVERTNDEDAIVKWDDDPSHESSPALARGKSARNFIPFAACAESQNDAIHHRTIECSILNPDFLEFEKTFRKSFGYTVPVASSGRRELELLPRIRETRFGG